MAALDRGLGLAWVTGATSYLGRHVARGLAARGHHVVGFARHASPNDVAAAWGFKAIEVGSFGAALLERSLARFGAPRIVFHAIGSGSVGQALADPTADAERTLGTLESVFGVLRGSARTVRLIYPSSAAVYGNLGVDPTPETAPTCPISIYGQNKLAAEEICRRCAYDNGFEIVIARFFSVFGSPQRKLLFWELGRRLLAGKSIITLGGTGAETRDFIHASDAAAAVLLLAESNNPPEIVNIGSGEPTSIETATALLAAALNTSTRIEFSGVTRPGDPPHQQADTVRLRALSFIPQMGLELGLGEYGAWLQKIATKAYE